MTRPMLLAMLAAALYAINIPIAKWLLADHGPMYLAAMLYLGAGFGMLALRTLTRTIDGDDPPGGFTRAQIPFVVGMVGLDIAAPIALLFGLRGTTAANASLLNNFEIVATAAIAFAVFREQISRRLLIAIVGVFAASVVLSFADVSSLKFSYGSLLVLLAAVCWGMENNCTRMLSSSSTSQIVVVKGVGSGMGSLVIALTVGEHMPGIGVWLVGLGLGFVSYGLSIFFYVRAQRDLGAAKTSAFYAIAPFLGVAFSLAMFRNAPTPSFLVGLGIMAFATWFALTDSIGTQHTHEHSHTHTHEHAHDGYVHTHEHTHVHTHLHAHDASEVEVHSHDHDPVGYGDHQHHHQMDAASA